MSARMRKVMDEGLNRAAMVQVLLDAVHAADEAEDGPAAIAAPFRLGGGGESIDLVVAADEIIGFVVCPGGVPLDGLAARLARCARLFDRVVLAVAPSHLAAAAAMPLAGAALWSIDASGVLREHRPGLRNAIAPGSLLTLMPPAWRAALLRSAIGPDAFDRTRPAIAADRLRACFGATLGTPVTRYALAITPPDVRRAA